MAMNISCEFEKASYNIFLVRAVTVKSLYTLRRRRRRRNEVKSIVSTGCYPVDTMTTQAINICEELLGNKKYKQKSTYKDVLGWLQGTIKPYLQNFNLWAFCVQNRQFPAGQWYCEPCDMETPDSSDSLNSI